MTLTRSAVAESDQVLCTSAIPAQWNTADGRVSASAAVTASASVMSTDAQEMRSESP